MIWSTGCPDWEKRIVAGRSLVPCPPLYPAEAAAALAVFRELKIVDAAGSPAMGVACRQWVFDFVAAIFGAYDAESGRRLIREFLLSVAKKNGKSTIAAGIMLTALVRNWRKSAEYLIVAPTIEVAQNSFNPARDMIAADERLAKIMHVNANTRTITHHNTKATLKVVAADNETVAGKKAVGVLIDELWLFGKRSNGENTLREATGGLASRPEGFVVYLSTQSDDIPAGVFKQQLEKFRQIRDGEVEDRRSMPVLYEWPKAMLDAEAWRDPANFYITNPNLGASVDEEYLRDKFEENRRAGPASLTGFLAKNLNIEIGVNLRAGRWAGADLWAKQADGGLTYEALLERSEVVVIGIDGGGLDDLFGLCVLGRDAETKHWLAWAHAWCHDGVLERRKSIAARLRDFKAAGDLTIVDDELADISAIVEIVAEVDARGLLACVAVDPAGLGELVDALDEIDVTQENDKLIGVGQGYRLMNAIKTAERKLANGTLWHSGSALMAWCVGNLKIEPTATAIRATKQSAGDAKIDPAMALFDAVSMMVTNPYGQIASPWEDDAAVVQVL